MGGILQVREYTAVYIGISTLVHTPFRNKRNPSVEEGLKIVIIKILCLVLVLTLGKHTVQAPLFFYN